MGGASVGGVVATDVAGMATLMQTDKTSALFTASLLPFYLFAPSCSVSVATIPKIDVFLRMLATSRKPL